MSEPNSLLEHFQLQADRLGEQPAVWRLDREGVPPLSWSGLRRLVWRTAASLRRLGVEPGDRVVHVSENRWEWIVTDLALLTAGAVHVPAHAPQSGAQIAYQARHTDARLLIFSNREQQQKLQGQSFPAGLKTLAYDTAQLNDFLHPQPWLEAAFGGAVREGEAICRRTLDACRPDDVTTILYTSGTTGEPKGVMLSHRNLTSNAVAAHQVFEQQPADVRLSFLPLSHIFARTCDLYCTLIGGSQIGLARARDTVLADAQQMKPTHLNGVPYFYDKLQQGLTASGHADTPGALHAMLGGRIKFLCSGGAPLDVETYDFFAARDLPILQGYGLTETSPVISASTLQHHRSGASGKPLPGVEVRCAEDGELLTRGPHVMLGYYQDPQATAEMIRDGWLYTGDLAEIDGDGFVHITGRKKELIVTSSGKNVAPTLLEQHLQRSPLIEQAMVVGDNRSYLTAVLVVDRQAVEAACGEPISSAAAETLLQREVDTQLADCSHHEQVRRFIIRDEPFSIEAGELTPKLSLRRNAVYERHREAIDGLYESSGEG